jgi:hypothetical protein
MLCLELYKFAFKCCNWSVVHVNMLYCNILQITCELLVRNVIKWKTF